MFYGVCYGYWYDTHYLDKYIQIHSYNITSIKCPNNLRSYGWLVDNCINITSYGNYTIRDYTNNTNIIYHNKIHSICYENDTTCIDKYTCDKCFLKIYVNKHDMNYITLTKPYGLKIFHYLVFIGIILSIILCFSVCIMPCIINLCCKPKMSLHDIKKHPLTKPNYKI